MFVPKLSVEGGANTEQEREHERRTENPEA